VTSIPWISCLMIGLLFFVSGNMLPTFKFYRKDVPWWFPLAMALAFISMFVLSPEVTP